MWPCARPRPASYRWVKELKKDSRADFRGNHQRDQQSHIFSLTTAPKARNRSSMRTTSFLCQAFDPLSPHPTPCISLPRKVPDPAAQCITPLVAHSAFYLIAPAPSSLLNLSLLLPLLILDHFHHIIISPPRLITCRELCHFDYRQP